MNSSSGETHTRGAGSSTGHWNFLTNHAHVLLCVAHDPGIRLREIAAAVGVTERSAHKTICSASSPVGPGVRNS